MSTTTTTYTYTHSVNHVTDRILNDFIEVIREVGLDPSLLTDDWEVLERGIRVWLGHRELESLHLEIVDPEDEELLLRWDFQIDYDYPTEDMWDDPGAIRAALAKIGKVPGRCHYRVVASAPRGRDVDGWSPTRLRSTEGMVRQGVGTSAAAPELGAEGSYLRASP